MAEARILYIATAQGLVQLANPGKSDRWREVGRSLPGQDLRSVVASPNDALLALAASSEGVALSTNGGMSWESALMEPTRSLVFDAAGKVYASSDDGAIFESDDGGDWTEMARTPTPILSWSLLPDGTLLGVGVDGQVYQRSDAGCARRDLQWLDVLALAADPNDAQSLLVLGQQVLYTPRAEHVLPAAATGALLMLHGQQPVLLIGTREGLLRSDDLGVTLQSVAGPADVTVLVTPPRFIDQAFAGTAGGALWFSADRGRTWAELRSGYPPIQGIAFARAL